MLTTLTLVQPSLIHVFVFLKTCNIIEFVADVNYRLPYQAVVLHLKDRCLTL